MSISIQDYIEYGIAAAAVIFGVSTFTYRKIKAYKTALRHKKNNPLNTLTKDTLIQEYIAELKIKIGADRVYVDKFHNGGDYFDGTAIKKVSRVYESCKKGVSHENQTYQNVPTTLIPTVMAMIQESVKDNVPVLKNVDDIEEGFLKNHMINASAKITVKYRLNVGTRLVGFLGIQFCTDNITMNDDMIDNIKEAAGQVENILTTMSS
jgi:hypothetical protein